MYYVNKYVIIIKYSLIKENIMIWDENKHPRNNEGKFTFKGGGSNSNTKENPASILYRDSKIKAGKDKQESEYKSKLLNILGNRAKPTDVLYGTTKELEEKVKDYGLESKLRGIITGGASGIENQETKQKVKLLPKIELDNSQTPLKGGISYDDIKTDSNIKPVSNITTNINKTWNTDTDFKKAMPHLLNREGNYSNHALDKGGKTKYGITKDTLEYYQGKYNKFGNINIHNLTKEQAAQIYYDEYWKKSGADKIKDKNLAYVHFDATVNHGLGNSRKFLVQSGGDFDKYIEIRRNFYKAIVKNNPKQDVFYKGWMNRLDEIKKNKGKY